MTDRNTEPNLAQELLAVASQMRSLSNTGLRFTDDPYQVERFEQILALSARLVALVDRRPLPDIRRHFFEDRHYITPLAVVDTAVFDDAGRILLIQRADDQRWALPGGACEVEETPATGAAREVWEETGCLVEITDFLGVFDNRLHGGNGLHHLYCLLFAGTLTAGEARITQETLDVRWFATTDVPWDALSGSHPARIRHALRWKENPSLPAYFDRAVWEPRPTWQHRDSRA